MTRDVRLNGGVTTSDPFAPDRRGRARAIVCDTCLQPRVDRGSPRCARCARKKGPKAPMSIVDAVRLLRP